MPSWLIVTITVLTCLLTVGLMAEWLARRVRRRARRVAVSGDMRRDELPPGGAMPGD